MADQAPGIDPSSFVALISGLGAQAKIFLGAMENPLTGKTETPDLPKARTMISTLEMLETKTKGNLSPEEDQFIKMILTDLRMSFVKADSK